MAIRKEELLIRSSLIAFSLVLGLASRGAAQPAVDNVLERMVPPGTTGLAGARMEPVKQTVLYRKLVESRSIPQLDEFARSTGFDPRRDVRELLFATTPHGDVMLARGTFHPDAATLKSLSRTRHGEYDVWGQGTSGFCILDSTLAAAGDLPAVIAALDEWKSGSHTAAQPLLARASDVETRAQLWGVSTGLSSFLAEHSPGAGSGIDMSKILQGLEDTSFEADLSMGLFARVHGTTATEKDAVSLRDTFRGMVGFGRLKVPENQPELLKVWDGITVDQQGRSLTINVDIAQSLVDKLMQILNFGPVSRIG
jgi:hypothetical protein